ncbi:nucleotide-binding universal stress UspA family protein [Marinobacter pelagius]|uniref:Nucleotide-binding universal stress UspA family protein n=1 Tax=Marinobacter pelagius TaxID=379482 RepID=A0A366GN14_9GAMM|nr:universal stress protein [Marinobacter pelagius]RBP27611.1 nucleotide-binding universal stress UspA family protein [Marinobacter pelagius]
MYRKLLIAIDPEDDGEGKRALEAAVDLLAEDGELHLASVYSPGGGGFFPHVTEEAPEQKEAEVREMLDLLARKYLPLNLNASFHVVAGTAGDKLVGLAGQLCADLLILVSRGSSGYWPLRRATVEYVSVNAPCPVLVLPSLEKAEPEAKDEESD